eukprot:TRINITY_DN52830_c0_g2_i2.p1 TRINITY_DN52830_c0_g2~~TRINITY_DN52830_c0_g2_i2.p1  ORF type:complete len:339 (-),score=106.22 TRINITY_DN52830_c0_g2_i2:690-1706(-)
MSASNNNASPTVTVTVVLKQNQRDSNSDRSPQQPPSKLRLSPRSASHSCRVSPESASDSTRRLDSGPVTLQMLMVSDRKYWLRLMKAFLWCLFLLGVISIVANAFIVQERYRSPTSCRVWSYLSVQYVFHCLVLYTRSRAIAKFYTPTQTTIINVVVVLSVLLIAPGFFDTDQDGSTSVCIYGKARTTVLTLLLGPLWIYLCYRFVRVVLTFHKSRTVWMIAATGMSSVVLVLISLSLQISRKQQEFEAGVWLLNADALLTVLMTGYVLLRLYKIKLDSCWCRKGRSRSRSQSSASHGMSTSNLSVVSPATGARRARQPSSPRPKVERIPEEQDSTTR